MLRLVLESPWQMHLALLQQVQDQLPRPNTTQDVRSTREVPCGAFASTSHSHCAMLKCHMHMVSAL